MTWGSNGNVTISGPSLETLQAHLQQLRATATPALKPANTPAPGTRRPLSEETKAKLRAAAAKARAARTAAAAVKEAALPAETTTGSRKSHKKQQEKAMTASGGVQ
jgi:hypothetical protein